MKSISGMAISVSNVRSPEKSVAIASQRFPPAPRRFGNSIKFENRGVDMAREHAALLDRQVKLYEQMQRVMIQTSVVRIRHEAAVAPLRSIRVS